MNKKGFTLMELLVVIVIVAVVSVSATISFSSIDGNTAVKERENKYKEIQRAASLYVDLSDQATLNQFISDGKLYIPFTMLAAENYIDKYIEDPVTGNILVDFDSSVNAGSYATEAYSVILYIIKAGDVEQRVSSCIAKRENDPEENTIIYKCVSDENGKKCSDDVLAYCK